MPEVALHKEFIAVNGVKLHVVSAGPADGEPILMLHGFPEFWYGWRHQIEALAQAGFRVITPDQRGYNLSDKPRGLCAYNLDTLAADILGLIDHYGYDRVYLAGHDWGAAVAWHLATTTPERLHRLAILNVPHPHVMVETVRRSLRQLRKSWYIGFFQMPVLPELFSSAGDFYFSAQALLQSSKPGTFSDADITEYIRAWKQPGAFSSMINWYRAMGRRLDDGAFLNNARVTVPTIIIWGAQDRFLQREMAQESTTLCDDARVIYFEDATHWVQHEKPNEVNALLSEFFS